MDSLAFDDMYTRQTAIIKAHTQLCKWLLGQPQFADWMDPSKFASHSGIFWIKAGPGAGKSTPMKLILDHFNNTMVNCHILTFFFNA